MKGWFRCRYDRKFIWIKLRYLCCLDFGVVGLSPLIEERHYFSSNNGESKATAPEFLICWYVFRLIVQPSLFLRSATAGPWQISAKLPLCVLSLSLSTFYFKSVHICLCISSVSLILAYPTPISITTFASIFSWFFVTSGRNPFAEKEESLLLLPLLRYVRFLIFPHCCRSCLWDSWIAHFTFFLVWFAHVVLFPDCSFQYCFLMCLWCFK